MLHGFGSSLHGLLRETTKPEHGSGAAAPALPIIASVPFMPPEPLFALSAGFIGCMAPVPAFPVAGVLVAGGCIVIDGAPLADWAMPDGSRVIGLAGVPVSSCLLCVLHPSTPVATATRNDTVLLIITPPEDDSTLGKGVHNG